MFMYSAQCAEIFKLTLVHFSVATQFVSYAWPKCGDTVSLCVLYVRNLGKYFLPSALTSGRLYTYSYNHNNYGHFIPIPRG